MSQLFLSELSLPAASLGAENPLPPLGPDQDVAFEVDPSVPAEDRRYLGYRMQGSILPYLVQDGYDRQRKIRSLPTAVLENDILRGEFLLGLGGRLYSLVHKPSGRNLLFSNPVFQPANLAIRNAWFSGGVEWNCSMVGHSVFTCAPLFAGRVTGSGGVPILRMYEYERSRGLLYQIDAFLPARSPYLLVRVCLTNTHEHEIPTYWWSNIAVPESPDSRVIVPAHEALSLSFQGGKLSCVKIPHPSGKEIDVTYPTQVALAEDFFYRTKALPGRERPWIASLDGQGRGLVQASTARLGARKLFVWGMSGGGRRWQEFLSDPALPGYRPYIEIQAGLAQTQYECLPMPGKARWSWVEAYGLMEADPKLVHGQDWDQAVATVRRNLDRDLPQARLEEELRAGQPLIDQPMDEMFHRGSGWGALEEERRKRDGQAPLATGGVSFPADTLGPEQEPWLELLRKGVLPAEPAGQAPASYVLGQAWRDRLQQAIAGGRSDHHRAHLHLGVMLYQEKNAAGAEAAWRRSLELQPSAWAHRNLAVLAKDAKKLGDAAERWLEAWRLAPGLAAVVVECCMAQLAAGRPGAVMEMAGQLPEPAASHPRVRLLIARAGLEIDDIQPAETLFAQPFEVTDLREGEGSLSNLWYAYQEKRAALAEHVTIDEELKARVRREFPAPGWLVFGGSV